MASVWISDRHHQAAFTTVCLRFVLVLDCYGSLSHIFDRDRVARAVVDAKRK